MEDKHQPIVSAMFMDFDNWLGGILIDVDSALGAEEVVTSVKKLHDSLVEGKDLNRNENGPLFGRRRRLIDCRVYINAKGRSKALEKKGTFYDYFFMHLKRLGFEVVDCQGISSKDKSHADVRMTMDIVQMLERRKAQLDEVILISSDTDFSPLISSLKSQVYVTLIACGSTGQFLRQYPDHYIDHEEALKHMGWLEDKHKAPIDVKERDPEEAKQEAVEFIKHQLEASDTYIPIAILGIRIRNLLGSDRIEDTEWFGCKKLDSFIRHECGKGIRVEGNDVWLEAKHKAPIDVKERDPDEAKQKAVDIIKDQLEASDTYIPIGTLEAGIRSLLGSNFIADAELRWFGYEKLRCLIRDEYSEGIRVVGNYVWLRSKHKTPIDVKDPDEAGQEAVDLIKRRLEAFDTYIPIATLAQEIRNLLGRELIEDTGWFGHKKLGDFIRKECGEGIRVKGHDVWLEDKYKAPSSDIDMKERDPEEAKQEAVEFIKRRLEISDTYIHLLPWQEGYATY